MGGDGALTGERGSIGGLSLGSGRDKAKCFLAGALEEWWWWEGRK
jgi:hypothetical protein